MQHRNGANCLIIYLGIYIRVAYLDIIILGLSITYGAGFWTLFALSYWLLGLIL